MSRTSPRFTRADYERLPEGFPCELLEGDLVKEPSPAYQHQRVSLRLAARLLPLVGEERMVLAPMDVFLDEFNVLQPDLAVFSRRLRARTRRLPVPNLVVEVLSPATADRDRERKTDVHLRAGVREVWLVDPDTGAIEVRAPAGARSYAPPERVESKVVAGFDVVGSDLVR